MKKILEKKNTVGKREEHSSQNIIGKHSKIAEKILKAVGGGGEGTSKNKRYLTCRKHRFKHQ